MTNLYLIVSDIAVVIGGCPGSPADRKSTRLNSSHSQISYAVFCLKKKKKNDLDVRDELDRERLDERVKNDEGVFMADRTSTKDMPLSKNNDHVMCQLE